VLVNTASNTVVVPPGARVTWLVPRTRKGPEGETLPAKFTVPEKPLMLVTLRKVLLSKPCATTRKLGDADNVKSAVTEEITENDPNTWWNREPLAPVAV
jgi:hypothetical protein